MHKGSCLCGAVKFEVEGSLSAVEGCHCSMCRKWTGHYHILHSKTYKVLPAFDQRIEEIQQVGQAYQAEYPAFARVEIRLVVLIAFQAGGK